MPAVPQLEGRLAFCPSIPERPDHVVEVVSFYVHQFAVGDAGGGYWGHGCLLGVDVLGV